MFNLVGVAASFGFATLVFQHGYGASLLGIEHQGFVDAWAPLFFFALLFGLSMDYQLFLLAAIKERHDATGDARLAVREGIARTGRPITNAALIMIVVFVAFGVTGPIPPDRARRHPRPRRPARRHRHPHDARPVPARDARRTGLASPGLARPSPPARRRSTTDRSRRQLMEILTIETKSLGDRSYVVVDGNAAAVIDPQRDIDRVLAELDERGLTLAVVLETHLHNDYVTGGLELAQTHRRRLRAAGRRRRRASTTPAPHDGDEFTVGDTVVLRAVHTPGHTPHHLSYVVVDGGEPAAVFTGGSLLYGTVGRTDLISDDATEELTRAQYRSARRLADELPGHGERAPHPRLRQLLLLGVVERLRRQHHRPGAAHQHRAHHRRRGPTSSSELLSGLTAYPRYYAHMAPRNRQGPDPVDLSAPEPVDPVELRRRIHAGEWVVDLRDRKAFAQSHLAGTINVEIGDSFVTYLGWTIRWGTPVTLVGDTADEVAEAQRQLVRIGIDRPAGAATGGLDTLGRRRGPPLLPQRHLRRARRRAPRRRAHRPRRPPRRRVGRRPPRRRHPHPPRPARGPHRRGPRRPAGVGALRIRVPRLDRRVARRPGRPRRRRHPRRLGPGRQARRPPGRQDALTPDAHRGRQRVGT